MMDGNAQIRTVLVPLEMAESGEKILSAVEEIARLDVGEIRLLHVANVRDILAAPAVIRHDTKVLEGWKERLVACGAPAVTAEVVGGIPWIEITERSEREAIDLIVMGSHGRGLVARMLLGSETENILHHAHSPVLVIRLEIAGTGDLASCRLASGRLFRRILFATDFSEDARMCIPCLSWIAGARPEELIVLHIQDTRHLSYATEEQMAEFDQRDAERLLALKQELEAAGFPEVGTVLKTGNAISEILDLARQRHVTLIVLGAKGRQGIAETVLGGVTETIVHRADAHVLVAR